MITLIRNGRYTVIETKHDTKILTLDGKTSFAWIHATKIGELLIKTHATQLVDHILSIGKYRLYEVLDEINLTDLPHLELYVGENTWQGYLLPTGLPVEKKKKSRIIPTTEIITKAIS